MWQERNTGSETAAPAAAGFQISEYRGPSSLRLGGAAEDLKARNLAETFTEAPRSRT